MHSITRGVRSVPATLYIILQFVNNPLFLSITAEELLTDAPALLDERVVHNINGTLTDNPEVLLLKPLFIAVVLLSYQGMACTADTLTVENKPRTVANTTLVHTTLIVLTAAEAAEANGAEV